MNLIDLYVTEIIGKPYQVYGIPDRWFVRVMADGYGTIAQSTVMCDSLENAQKVGPGFVFQG
jgi:hypothetical protein